MIIGLYNLEPHIVNTAMMQVSQYHKDLGDTVEPYLLFNHNYYDKIYAFSMFDFTDKGYVRSDMICGGTGFDVKSKLPPEISAKDYDWSLYPHCDFSIIWFSRGCNRNCPFCVVRQKEGKLHPVRPKNLNPNGTYIKVMDNNFFGNPEWRAAIKQLQEWGQTVDFQSVDLRIVTEEMIVAVKTLNTHNRRIKIAWDNPREDMVPYLERIKQWTKPYIFMVYVLIGYWSTPEEDLMRVKKLKDLGYDPFIMPFDKHDYYQKNFARWVNTKQIFKTISWEDFKARNYQVN